MKMNGEHLSVTGLIRRHAIEFPEKLALAVGDVCLTYQELYRRISAAAAWFLSNGIKPGSHVLSMAAPSVEFVVCEYALLGLGAVHIPVENRAPVDRISEIAAFVDAEFVISPEQPIGNFRWISPADIDMDGEMDLSWTPVGVSADCSEIVFTTGTTGKSKGVMLSSQCLEVYMAAINPSFGLDEDSVFLLTTPLNHVGGMHRIHQCMAVGSTIILMDGVRDLKAFFENIDRYGVTHTYLPPAAVKLLITLARKELARVNGKIKFIYTASAPFPVSDIEMLMRLMPNTHLHQGYGSSETGSVCNCCYNAPGENPNCLGKPYPCVEVFLQDEDGAIIKEAFKAGYIRSKSGMNMLGYYKEPELTAGVLKDGFIYSNDLMYFDEQGKLYFAGRGDDVINVRGFKIAPTEIEDCAQKHPSVLECVCIPYDDQAYGRVVKLLVHLKDGYSLDQKALTGFLMKELEPYKLPKYIQAVDNIPRTGNGKLNRKAIIRQYSNIE